MRLASTSLLELPTPLDKRLDEFLACVRGCHVGTDQADRARRAADLALPAVRAAVGIVEQAKATVPVVPQAQPCARAVAHTRATAATQLGVDDDPPSKVGGQFERLEWVAHRAATCKERSHQIWKQVDDRAQT